MDTKKLAVLFCFFIVVLCSCQPKKRAAPPSNQLKVIATTGMIYDAVRVVGGDSVQSAALMGPGVDPHLYKATQHDLKQLKEADMIFYNGLFLEGKMGDILQKQAVLKPVVAVGEALADTLLYADPQYKNAYDPHIWFDITLWKEAVRTITTHLVAQDMRNKDFYTENMTNYLLRLDSLEDWVKDKLNQIPQTQRILITSHDAFGYFGRAYNIEVLGLQGMSTQTDFGLRDISSLVNNIVEKKVPAIFAETSVSDKALQAVIEGVAAKGHHLRIGGRLYSDAMGPIGTPAGTYIGMFQENIQTIVSALTQQESQI